MKKHFKRITSAILSALIISSGLLIGVIPASAAELAEFTGTPYSKETTTSWDFSDETQFDDFTAHQDHKTYGYLERTIKDDRFWYEERDDKMVLRSNWEAYDSEGGKYGSTTGFTAYMNSISLKNTYKNFSATMTIKSLASDDYGAAAIGFRETLPGKHNTGDNWDSFGVQGDGNYSGYVQLFNNSVFGATAAERFEPVSITNCDYKGEWTTLKVTVIGNSYRIYVYGADGTQLYRRSTTINSLVAAEGYISFYASNDVCISDVSVTPVSDDISFWDFNSTSDYNDFTAHQNNTEYGYYERPLDERFWYLNSAGETGIVSCWEAYTSGGVKVGDASGFTKYMNSISLTAQYESFVATATTKYLGSDAGAAAIGFRETKPGKHSTADSWDTFGVQGDGVFSGFAALYQGHAIGATGGAKFGPDFAGSPVTYLTIRLTVIKRSYTLEVLNDAGKVLYTNTASMQSDVPDIGYVSFYGSNDMEIDCVSIQEIETIDTNKFTSYFVDNAKTTENMTAVGVSSYWYTGDTTLVRNDQDCGWGSADENISYLYYNVQKYKSFEMQVDYKVIQGSTDYVNHGCVFGFGATQMGISPYFDSNVTQYGIIQYGGLLTSDYSNWISLDFSAPLVNIVNGYQMFDTHRLKVRVKNDLLDVWLDEVKVLGTVLNKNREEGYIFFGSNELSTTFGIPHITELEDDNLITGSEDSPLHEKSVLFVGDDISYGIGDDYYAYSWAGRIGNKYGMSWKNSSVTGSTITSTGNYPVIENQLTDGNYDYVVIEGGINDVMYNLDLGEVTTGFNIENYDVTTFAGALEHLFCTASAKYPNAKLSYIIIYNAVTESDNAADIYYSLARKICEKWRIEYIDLFNDAECNNYISADTTLMSDGIHMNSTGYSYLAGKIESLITAARQPVRYDFNGDYVANSTDLSIIRTALLDLRFNSDINGDGACDIRDLVNYKKLLAGIF